MPAAACGLDIPFLMKRAQRTTEDKATQSRRGGGEDEDEDEGRGGRVDGSRYLRAIRLLV